MTGESPCPGRESSNDVSSNSVHSSDIRPSIDPAVRGKIAEYLSLKNYDEIAEVVVESLVDMKDLIVLLAITSVTVLTFIFGYYCINKCRKESPLINNVSNCS